MRGLLGILGLLLAVAVVGLLAKKQLTARAPAAAPVAGGAAPAAVPLQQLPQQMRQAMDEAMRQPRPVPDDK